MTNTNLCFGWSGTKPFGQRPIGIFVTNVHLTIGIFVWYFIVKKLVTKQKTKLIVVERQ